MAKSIILGSDTYLHASGIVGIKAVLTSGNLNNFVGFQNSGTYYLNAAQSAFSNSPLGWGVLIVIANNNNIATTQIAISTTAMFTRQYTGSPLAWTAWYKYTGTAV
jgi:hypothetical protein